jgi:hypothetical protein
MKSSARLYSLSFFVVFATLIASTTAAFAQKRLLVSSHGEVIPISKGQSAKAAIDRMMKSRLVLGSPQAVCDSGITLGYPDYIYPVNLDHLANHKDVFGEWYTPPVGGTIESVYVHVAGSTGDPNNQGGTLGLRIFQSNIGYYTDTTSPYGVGPGYGGFSAPPETTCWGYYNSTADLDNGVAAFIEDVQGTDTIWHSKYYLNSDHKDTNSFPPTGAELWGHGGWPINILHTTSSDTIAGVAMADDPTLTASVKAGVPFFITLTVPGNHPAYIPYCPDEFDIESFPDPTQVTIGAHEDWTPGQNPTESVKLGDHVWKFYEHFFGHCQDMNDTEIVHPPCPAYETEAGGWIARGYWNEDIWYVLRPDSVSIPSFQSIDVLHNTYSSASRVVTCTTLDCNYAGGPAGTANVDLVLTVNDTTVTHVAMASTDGGTTWQATIPGAPCGCLVRYTMTATDVTGSSSNSPELNYSVLCAENEWFTFDTTSAQTPKSIVDIANHGGTAIDTSKFFNVAGGSRPGDDGSAGPFPIGSFPWFGDTMHYAWVNVNGAISISKTATDTIVANFGGSTIAGGAILPYPQRNKFTADGSTNTSGIGRNFIAPLFCDLDLGDTDGQYGNIFTKFDSIDNKFIVEWAGVGDYNSLGPVEDVDTFAVVLNNSLGTLEFVYYDVGINSPRLDSVAIVGIEADSALANPGYFQTNDFASPPQTKPRNNWGIALIPTQTVSLADGWNMISVPGREIDSAKTYLYPSASSSAFAYVGGYVRKDTLQEGLGYWMKFSSARTLYEPGAPINSLTIHLNAGWKMIGGPSVPVPVSNIILNGGGFIFPSENLLLFGYNNGFSSISVLQPGQGYWIKSTGADSLTLTLTGSGKSAPKATPITAEFNRMNSFTVKNSGKGSQTLYIGNEKYLTTPLAAFELPPVPPAGAFDARFSSNYMVEMYPSALNPSEPNLYVINLHSATYPVTFQYKVSNSDNRAFVLTDGNGGKLLGNTILNGSGKIQITNSAITSLSLKLITTAALPKTFALSQNYPNPFNPTTRMTVDVPQSGAVDVAVYDILGRKIASLMSGEQTAGSHTVEWDGKNERGGATPSGTYFIRMSAADFSTVKKILLMK